jgi:hypothetical protein
MSPSFYHQISLLPCFGKVFESIMCKRIENATLRCGAISTSQLGGIQQHFAIDALIVITTPMSLALRRPLKGRKTKTCPKPTLAPHDIEGAFNDTNPKGLEATKNANIYYSMGKRIYNRWLLSFEFDGISEPRNPLLVLSPKDHLSPLSYLQS